jgi:hypothetical protein
VADRGHEPPLRASGRPTRAGTRKPWRPFAASSREAITDTLARIDRRQLEAGLESLKGRLASATDPEGALARSLRATLEIQEKRLTNLDAATNNLAVIDAELERIEQQVRLVREESAISRSPEALSSRLDSVSQTLSETSRWMDQHADLLSDMTSADIDSTSVPSLPRTPAEPALDPDEPEEPQQPRPPRPRVGQRHRQALLPSRPRRPACLPRSGASRVDPARTLADA